MPVITYGDNIINNPSAESDLTGWTTSGNITVADDGPDGAKCFVFPSSGWIYQETTPGALLEPYNFEIKGLFKPDVAWANDPHIGAYVIVTLFMLNGKRKVLTIPMRSNDYNGAWHTVLQTVDANEEGNPVVKVRLGAKTYNRTGRFDGFSLRKELAEGEGGGEPAGGLTVTGALTYETPTVRTIGVTVVEVFVTGTLS